MFPLVKAVGEEGEGGRDEKGRGRGGGADRMLCLTKSYTLDIKVRHIPKPGVFFVFFSEVEIKKKAPRVNSPST